MMITKEKIEIYKKYDGDIDMWARLNRKSERFMRDSEWSLIKGFVQDLILINNGLASDTYIKAFNERLTAVCDHEDTIAEIIDLNSKKKLKNKDNFLKSILGVFTRKN